VNEEYGYEDHYPFPWGEGRKWPARVADNRRRLAWEMCMAGAYQTTGERANVPGYGGWITGRGNKEMVMLEGYARMREFFENAQWWLTEPHPELVSGRARCLAKPGEIYLVYVPDGSTATVKLESGRYAVRQFDPQTGRWRRLNAVESDAWNSPAGAEGHDLAFQLSRVPSRGGKQERK
jgi:hypothetical protein